MHVGSSVRGKSSIKQRLGNHLAGKSSFARCCLQGNPRALRNGYTYQYIVVPNDRTRSLLEHAAVARLCPAHLGAGCSGHKHGI
jgi:hypothetical protein